MKHYGKDTCVMSEACEGKPADHGLMCEDCRVQDMAIAKAYVGCNDCPACRSKAAVNYPCKKEAGDE